MRVFILFLGLLALSPCWAKNQGAYETTPVDGSTLITDTAASAHGPVILVDSNQDKNNTPENGALIIPGDDSSDKKPKKCLTVCKNWGQDCIINPRTGATNCRRTCKEFGRECF